MTANHPEDLVARPPLTSTLVRMEGVLQALANDRPYAASVVADALAEITSLVGERDALRTALIAAGRAAGAGLSDDVSSEFLSHVPGEVAAAIRNRDETIAAQAVEIEAAKLFGGGYYGPTVTEFTRGWYRAEVARRALASPHQEGTGT